MNALIVVTCIFSIIQSLLIILIGFLLGSNVYLKYKQNKKWKGVKR